MWTGPSSKCDIFDVGRIDEHSSMLVLSIILIRLDSALVSFTPGHKHARVEYYPHSALLMTVHWCHLLQVRLLASRTRCPSSRVCFSAVSVRLSSLKAPSAALRAAVGGFWVDRRTGTVKKQARGKGTRVRDANILTWRTALSTPITGPGKSTRSGPDGLHNRGGKRPL